MRLSDLGSTLSYRRLGVLLRQLPAESRTARAQGGPMLEWNVATHLLATIVDLLAAANWQRGGGKGTRPKPLARPGVDQKETRSRQMGTPIDRDEARRILDQWGT